MIDATQALLEQTNREIARLVALRVSLEAFIEQPGSSSGGEPALASQAEAVRNGSRTSAHQAEERGFDSRPPLHAQSAAVSLACSFCGREFPNRRGLPMHESRCEQNPERIPPWVPKAEGGKPPLQVRPSRETFLCDRCRDTFPSRQALAEHRRSHPEVVPAPGPMRRAAGSLSAIGGLG